jgi:sugar lactone lactonase YvrE
MNKNSISFRCALAGLLVIGFAISGRSQPLTFNTLAGYPGGGSSDGARAAARFYNPCGVATDNAGNVYVADTGNHAIRKVSPTGVVTTLAGLSGVSGSVDGTGGAARFNQPGGVAVDTAGNVYVADTGNHTIRLITPAGVVSTWAGMAGVSGSGDATGTNAQFNLPQGITVSSVSNVYVADYGNHTIRKITPGRVVRTLAGAAGSSGSTDGSGSNARFYQPQGVAVDAGGFVYVADTANGTIRKITPAGGVSTLAGTAGNYGSGDGSGTNVQFYQPESVAVDASGNVYVADYFNHTIRKVTAAGMVSTLAGSPGSFGSVDGAGSDARFWGPEGVAVDSAGRVFVADTGNGTIRKILPSGVTVAVTTLAGSASSGSVDATGSDGRFYWPGGVAVKGTGEIYVADTENATIRKLTTAGLASTLAGSAGSYGTNNGSGTAARFYGPQGIALDGAGNIYVADAANSTIRMVTSGGVVSTLAGTAGLPGSLDGTNVNAQFYQPQAVAVDGSGTVYVADTWNHTIRKITPSGVVSTVAGLAGNYGATDGTNNKARFYWPAGIAVDGLGNLYVSDYFNHTIRLITPSGPDWVVTTVAGMPGAWGSADGTNGGARFYRPQGIAADSAGNLYVVDSGNETIRKIVASGTNWVVSTVAGLPGTSGSVNGLGNAARFYSPAAVALGAGGAFYLADAANNDIRLGSLITNGAPAIIVQPQSQTVDPGSSVTFSVTATGGTSLSYQWRFNGTNISGMTASSYTRTNAQTADAGNYSVFITNLTGSVISADASLNLNHPPFIVTQPQSQIVGLGQSATFTVVAVGDAPLGYQWRFLGNNIPGATNSSFTLPSVQGSNNGSYSVVVDNFVSAVTSSNAMLAVIALSATGDNSFGQTNVPVSATNTIAIAAGTWHNLALHADGRVVAWGNDFEGQCDVPPALTDALAIAAGGYHSLAIRANGTVLGWGANDYGQTTIPAGLKRVIAITCGTWHSLALRSDGSVVGWGDNTRGQLSIPEGLSGITAIAAGGNHSLALKADGTVMAWGENSGAGGGFAGQSIVPPDATNVIGLAAGEFHSLALRSNGTVIAWGDNAQGQCTVPDGLSNVVALAGGSGHSLALTSDGRVVAWGVNWNGQCDFPSFLSDAIGVSAGGVHSLALVQTILPDPRLLSPSWDATGFSVLLQTLNRKTYVLDFNNLAVGGNWIPLSTNAGNGALRLLTDPDAIGLQRFYRMRQW